MLSRKFSDKRLFMPSSCDFRGRIYQVPSYLNYQGPDHCRGLLQFHRGMPIKSDDDLKWLAIHGANCFGNDKCAFEERLKWADGFTKDAIRIANDPKGNRPSASVFVKPGRGRMLCHQRIAHIHTTGHLPSCIGPHLGQVEAARQGGKGLRSSLGGVWDRPQDVEASCDVL